MKTIDIILIIFLGLVLLMVILLPVVKHFNGKVCRVIFRINDARESLDSKIKAKYNLLIDMINYSELNFNVKSKTFIQIKKLSGHFDFNNDKLFNKGYNEIIKIVEDNESANEVKKLKSYLKKYEDNELHIISLRTYYNKYALIYNNIIKKFPYSIFSKIKGYKLTLLFEGEELALDEENIIEV